MSRPTSQVTQVKKYDQLSCRQQTAIDWYLEGVNPSEWEGCGTGGNPPSTQEQKDAIAANSGMVEYILGRYNDSVSASRS